MKRASFGTVVAAVLLGSGLVEAQQLPLPEQYQLRLEYRSFKSEPIGEVQNGFGETEGTLIDLSEDLGVREASGRYGRVIVQLKPGHKLRGTVTELDYDGDVAAGRSFDYGETTFLRGNRVVTSLKGYYYTGEYEYDFVKAGWGYVGGLVGAKIFDFDALLASEAQGAQELETLRLPIPVLGLAGRAYLGGLSLEAEASGLTIGERGHIFELDGSIRLHVSDRMAAQAGYRILALRGKDAPDLIDVTIRGWSWGIEISM